MGVHHVEALPLYLLNKIEMSKPGPLWGTPVRQIQHTTHGILRSYLTSNERSLLRGALDCLVVITTDGYLDTHTLSSEDQLGMYELLLDCVLANECA